MHVGFSSLHWDVYYRFFEKGKKLAGKLLKSIPGSLVSLRHLVYLGNWKKN